MPGPLFVSVKSSGFRSKTGKFKSRKQLGKSIRGMNLAEKGRKRLFEELDDHGEVGSSAPRKATVGTSQTPLIYS